MAFIDGLWLYKFKKCIIIFQINSSYNLYYNQLIIKAYYHIFPHKILRGKNRSYKVVF